MVKLGKFMGGWSGHRCSVPTVRGWIEEWTDGEVMKPLVNTGEQHPEGTIGLR